MVDELTYDGKISFTVEEGQISRLPYLIFYDIPSNRVQIGISKNHESEFWILITVVSEREWAECVSTILSYHKRMGDIIVVKRQKIKNKVLPLSIAVIHGRKLIRYVFLYRPTEPIIR